MGNITTRINMLSFFTFMKSKVSIHFCGCFGNKGPDDDGPLLDNASLSSLQRPDTPYPSPAEHSESFESLEDTIMISHHYRNRHGG